MSSGEATLDPAASRPDELTFVDGLVGLPDARRFELRSFRAEGLMELLSADDAGLGFVAALADDVHPGMHARLVELGHAGADSTVIVLLSVRGDPPVITANLAGPIVTSPDGTARQLVLEDPAFPVRAPLPGTD